MSSLQCILHSNRELPALVSVLSIAAAFWQGQAAHDRGLRLHHGRNRGPKHAKQGSAVLELGGTSHLSAGSAATSATSSAATSSGQKAMVQP